MVNCYQCKEIIGATDESVAMVGFKGNNLARGIKRSSGILFHKRCFAGIAGDDYVEYIDPSHRIFKGTSTNPGSATTNSLMHDTSLGMVQLGKQCRKVGCRLKIDSSKLNKFSPYCSRHECTTPNCTNLRYSSGYVFCIKCK